MLFLYVFTLCIASKCRMGYDSCRIHMYITRDISNVESILEVIELIHSRKKFFFILSCPRCRILCFHSHSIISLFLLLSPCVTPLLIRERRKIIIKVVKYMRERKSLLMRHPSSWVAPIRTGTLLWTWGYQKRGVGKCEKSCCRARKSELIMMWAGEWIIFSLMFHKQPL